MIGIGIIGCGGIANGRHITELLEIPECKITALCDIDEVALKKTAERIGIDEEHCYKDYKKLVECKEVDAVEICTPNYLHIPMAEYAVSKDKPVNVEKPLALCVDDTQKLMSAIVEKNVANMMCFSYRFFPAVRYAKHLLDNRHIGKIVGVNVEYLKSSAFMKNRRLDWRFVKQYAGTGVLGDLGVHLIDMSQFLIGDFKSVSALTGIVVKQRMRLDRDELADVETDDYCNFIASLEDRYSGEDVPATYIITRCARGHENTIKYDIFGTDGVITFDLNNPEMLGINTGDAAADIQYVRVPDEFSIKQEQMFVDMLLGKPCVHLPTIADGIKCQNIIDSILLSAETKRMVEIG